MEPIFGWLKSLHQADTFLMWLSQGGLWLVTGIIFAETGLLLGFFLPGDSLLITTGVLANPANPNHIPGLVIAQFHFFLTIAAIVGDQLGYFLGHKTGEQIYSRPDGRFFKQKYVQQAKVFFEKYGTPAIILARFVPIMRTFVPFTAGVARMNYRRYLFWDCIGGIIWINSLLLLGYFLGQTGLANRLDKVILVVIIVSVMPMVVGSIRQLRSKKL